MMQISSTILGRSAMLLLLGLVGCCILPGCGSKSHVQTQTRLQAEIIAAGDVNRDASSRSLPIVVRIYELKAIGGFRAADFYRLYDHEADALGPGSSGPGGGESASRTMAPNRVQDSPRRPVSGRDGRLPEETAHVLEQQGSLVGGDVPAAPLFPAARPLSRASDQCGRYRCRTLPFMAIGLLAIIELPQDIPRHPALLGIAFFQHLVEQSPDIRLFLPIA